MNCNHYYIYHIRKKSHSTSYGQSSKVNPPSILLTRIEHLMLSLELGKQKIHLIGSFFNFQYFFSLFGLLGSSDLHYHLYVLGAALKKNVLMLSRVQLQRIIYFNDWHPISYYKHHQVKFSEYKGLACKFNQTKIMRLSFTWRSKRQSSWDLMRIHSS